MAYQYATKAQRQALRDTIINATKVVEQKQEFGQPDTAVDSQLTALKAALDAVVAAAAPSA